MTTEDSLARQVLALDEQAMREEARAAQSTGELAEANERVRSIRAEMSVHQALALHQREQALALMEAAGITEMTVQGRSYRVKDSPGRVVFDDRRDFEKTNNRFVEMVETPKVDVRAIGAALKAGEPVMGVRLEVTRTLEMKQKELSRR